MIDHHRPDPTYRENLEWQVRTAARRKERFEVTRPSRRTRTAGVIALMLISVFCGAAGVRATEQIQDDRQKQLELRQLEVEMSLLNLRSEYSRDRFEKARQAFEAGLLSHEEYRRAEQELHTVEMELQTMRLKMEEVRSTGRAPVDRLSSPTTGERDYVSERIRLQLENARSRAALAEESLQREQGRYEAGLIPELTVMDSRATAVGALKAVENLETRLRLRERFVAGELDAEEIEREAALAEARNELQVTRLLLEIADERYQRLQALHESGGIDELEVRRAQIRLINQQVLIRQIEAQVRLMVQVHIKVPPPE